VSEEEIIKMTTKRIKCQWCERKTVQNSMKEDGDWRCTKCGGENTHHIKPVVAVHEREE